MKILLILVFMLMGITLTRAQRSSTNEDLEAFIQERYPQWEKRYKDLHQNPELSLQEKETAAFVANQMRSWGYEVQENFGEYGVVAIMRNGEGKTLLLRTDMDALPVKEMTGLPYASQKKMQTPEGDAVDVMHACGHDMHMSVWLSTAETAARLQSEWQGTLIMIAQPSEEIGSGAKAMLDAGLFQKYPKPDYAVALHVHAGMEAGNLGFCKGAAMANVDMVNIKIYGEGGHGAYPHDTKDPIVLASRIVLALQTIVSREISPLNPAVVTVGSIHGGTKHNIIPSEVNLELTLRSYSEEVREQTIAAIARIIKYTALSAGLTEEKLPKMEVIGNSLPAVFNNHDLSERLYKANAKTLGDDKISWVEPVMAAEDFSLYGRTDEAVPITLFWLGAVSAEKMKAHREQGIELPYFIFLLFWREPFSTL
ncbi:MAG: amidohydrolase, partial [Bernardetiaceae bacterium]|nr:amidohydrolase [Bernardetiaceae bacterium]